MIDGQPACDCNTRCLMGGCKIKADLRMPDDQFFPHQENHNCTEECMGYGPILHQDHRLPGGVRTFAAIFGRAVTGRLISLNCPAVLVCVAASRSRSDVGLSSRLVIVDHTAIGRFRNRSETNTAPWFASIVNAKPTTFTNTDGQGRWDRYANDAHDAFQLGFTELGRSGKSLNSNRCNAQAGVSPPD